LSVRTLRILIAPRSQVEFVMAAQERVKKLLLTSVSPAATPRHVSTHNSNSAWLLLKTCHGASLSWVAAGAAVTTRLPAAIELLGDGSLGERRTVIDRTSTGVPSTRAAEWWGRSTRFAILICWSVVCLFPLYWIAITSLKNDATIDNGPFYVPFVDFTPSYDAWAFLLADPYDSLLWRYVNSTVVGVISTLLTVALAGLALYGLTRFKVTVTYARLALFGIAFGTASSALFVDSMVLRLLLVGTALVLAGAAMRFEPGGPVVSAHVMQGAMLATRVLPPIVIVVPLYVLAQRTGTLDTHFALIFTYVSVNLPVAIWLLAPVLGVRASDQEEAAQLDGASHIGIFCTIVVPMESRSLAAVSLLIFILCWNEYLFAVHLGSNHALTLPPYLVGQMSMKEAQVGSEGEEWSRLSAATVLMVLPMLIVSRWAQRVLGRTAVWQSSDRR
jgi:multiple sugar transport system permease protein